MKKQDKEEENIKGIIIDDMQEVKDMLYRDMPFLKLIAPKI